MTTIRTELGQPRRSRRERRSGGFTLVEIMVSLMIFSLVVIVALAALTKIIDANRKAQTVQDAVISISYATEAMTREIRTGSNLYCALLTPGTDLSATTLSSQSVSASCTTGMTGTNANHDGVGFAFKTSRTDPSCGLSDKHLIIAYEIVPNMPGGTWDGTYVVKKAVQTSCTEDVSSIFEPIVSTSTVSIQNYYVQATNAAYPVVFVYLSGSAGTKEAGKTYFGLQTASSERMP